MISHAAGTEPLFGVSASELLFRPVTAAFCGQAAFFIEEAIRKWETRIDLDKVSIAPWGQQEGKPEPFLTPGNRAVSAQRR